MVHGDVVALDLTPRGSLTDGQVVTLLVGLGLELLAVHSEGSVFGPIHPAHVAVGDDGRPALRPVPSPIGWTPHDDWVALLRLGRVVGGAGRSAELSALLVEGHEGVELLRWLIGWSAPEPLSVLGEEWQ